MDNENRRLIAERLMNEVYKLFKDNEFTIIAKGSQLVIIDDAENHIYIVKYNKN